MALLCGVIFQFFQIIRVVNNELDSSVLILIFPEVYCQYTIVDFKTIDH